MIKQRTNEIIQLRKEGKTLQSIGDRYNITRERVRQILKEFDIKKPVIIIEKIPYKTKIKTKLLNRIYITKSNCWNFLGGLTKGGYGTMSYCGSRQYAHRVSYQVYNNITLINEGRNTSETICVLHTCGNRSCINPDHLYLGTQEDNAKDRVLDKIKKLI